MSRWRVWRGAGPGGVGIGGGCIVCGWGEDAVVVRRRRHGVLSVRVRGWRKKRVIRRLEVAVVVVLALSFVCLGQL